MSVTDHTIEQEIQQKDLEERLALMRDLEGRDVEECRRIADDTLEHYSTRAEQLGLYAIQLELQELAVKYGYPEDYQHLKKLLDAPSSSYQHIFETFKLPLCSMLDSYGIEYKFIYRMKSIYSVWLKMKKDGKRFDEVYDLFATRIIYKVPETVKPLSEIGSKNYTLDPAPLPLSELDAEKLICWRIYTIITALYHVQAGRIKDWVTTPKPSGYQALHLTCMGPESTWIEIQIRSERMDYEAEHGNAAHWKYKKSGE